jgi:hypothetical protein
MERKGRENRIPDSIEIIWVNNLWFIKFKSCNIQNELNIEFITWSINIFKIIQSLVNHLILKEYILKIYLGDSNKMSFLWEPSKDMIKLLDY